MTRMDFIGRVKSATQASACNGHLARTHRRQRSMKITWHTDVTSEFWGVEIRARINIWAITLQESGFWSIPSYSSHVMECVNEVREIYCRFCFSIFYMVIKIWRVLFAVIKRSFAIWSEPYVQKRIHTDSKDCSSKETNQDFGFFMDVCNQNLIVIFWVSLSFLLVYLAVYLTSVSGIIPSFLEEWPNTFRDLKSFSRKKKKISFRKHFSMQSLLLWFHVALSFPYSTLQYILM